MWIILLIWFACDVVGLIFLVLGCFIENHWKPKAAVKEFISDDMSTILGLMVLAPAFLVIGFAYFIVMLCTPLINKISDKFNNIKERILDWCES